MAEVQIRYLQDTDGERYFPVTHVDAIVGLIDFDDSGEIENLETLVNSMRVSISSLQTSNAKLITDLNNANQQIAQNKTDIQALKEQINPPEEGK